MFLLETFLVNIYNVLILRLSTFRKLDSDIAAITTLVLNLFFTLLFIADFAANELFAVEVCISIPKINFLNFIWVNPCIKLGDISSLSTFQPPVNFTAQSPFDLWDTKGWTPFQKCGNYYQCQPSLFIDPALMPKTCISWKTKNEALLERVNLDFYTNIVHITQWRSTAVSFAGGSVMDIFLCTSPEYFYTFRAEYLYKDNSISSLKKLLPPITKELVQSIIVQLPPTDAKPFYISDNLIFVYNNGLPQPGGDSITASLYYNKGLGQLGGAITAESIYFCYTPSLPFIFNFSSMYIPTTFT